MSSRIFFAAVAVLMLSSACGGGEGTATTTGSPPANTTSPPTDTTDPPPPTSSSTSSTSSLTEPPAPSTTIGASTTLPPETSLPGGELTRCESPEGYSIEYPVNWSTNPGDVVAPCGQFHPDGVPEPEATDERVAAITAYIDPVPFAEVAAPVDGRDAARAVTAIDGFPAVRLEHEADGDGLWPQGTPITTYMIDLPVDGQGSETLFLDTVGLDMFDYETNQVVLDRMARTLDVDRGGVTGDPAIVARYEGGGGGFSVEATTTGSEVCLQIPPDGDRICTDLPADDQLHTIQLTDLEPMLAGVTGVGVFAVTAHRRDGSRSTVLPAPIPDAGAGGFSFTFGLDAIEGFTLTDVTGEQIREVTPGG